MHVNVLFCSQRYHQSILNVMHNPVDDIIVSYVHNSVDYKVHMGANTDTYDRRPNTPFRL